MMSKPTEINAETIKDAAEWASLEMHHVSSSLNMPPYPLGKDGDPEVAIDKFMPELFHYVRHAEDHLFRAKEFANIAAMQMRSMRNALSLALLRVDLKGDHEAFRSTVEKILNQSERCA